MPDEITIHACDTIGLIRPELHGHFLEHLGTAAYGGIWVGRDSAIPNIDGLRRSAVDYLRELAVPVLRWPGGCFADEYSWRDGIGPAGRRPRTVNHRWGGVVEDNSFGTHEFMRLCGLIGAAPYLAANMGSGSPADVRDWVEYCNYPSGSTLSDMRRAGGVADPFAVRFWGLGNESWACGGNMTAEEYAAQYARFATFVPTCGGTVPYLIAVGPNNNDTGWTRRFFDTLIGGRMFMPPVHGYAMHFYSWGTRSATSYDPAAIREQFASFGAMEHGIVEQRAYLDAVARRTGIPSIDLLIDEWGTWDLSEPDVEARYGLFWQQNTVRDAVAAALGLNVFHRHADKLGMCNIAQIVNVLQASLLTADTFCVRTPTYHALHLMKEHRGRSSVRVETPLDPVTALSVSASRDERTLVVTYANPDPEVERTVRLRLTGATPRAAVATAITDPDLNACNTFEDPDRVVPRTASATCSNNTITATIPGLSVLHLHIPLA